MKRYISFSGGVESSAMCVLFGNKADAVFSDTGWEHKQIYERIGFVERRVREVHKNNFKVHRIKADATHNGVSTPTLQEYIRATNFYPSQMARYCTRMFKIEPIDKFLEVEGNVELMIGLNAEEKDRTGNHGLLENVKYRYPLIEANITRKGCIAVLKHANMLPSFPHTCRGVGVLDASTSPRRSFMLWHSYHLMSLTMLYQ